MFLTLLNPNLLSEMHEKDVKSGAIFLMLWFRGGCYYIGTIFAQMWSPFYQLLHIQSNSDIKSTEMIWKLNVLTIWKNVCNFFQK